jgi:hypothetical protein
MPGFLVHQGATVLCTHGGQAQPTVTSPRLKVGGQAVAVQTAPYTVSACSFPPPPSGNGPCVTAQWVTGALRVKTMSMPVLLADSQAVCAPTGTPLQIVVTQVRVKGQ